MATQTYTGQAGMRKIDGLANCPDAQPQYHAVDFEARDLAKTPYSQLAFDLSWKIMSALQRVIQKYTRAFASLFAVMVVMRPSSVQTPSR